MASKSIPVLDLSSELAAIQQALKPALVKLKKHLTKLEDLKVLPVGALADQLKDLQDLSSLMSHAVDPATELISPVRKIMTDHFINTLAVGESSGVQGIRARVQITESVVPIAEDWAKIQAHVKKTEDFAMLNRSLNTDHIRELWNDKKPTPGVGKFNAKKVSVTKLRGK